jgi:hypothetical protein
MNKTHFKISSYSYLPQSFTGSGSSPNFNLTSISLLLKFFFWLLAQFNKTKNGLNYFNN